LKRIIEDRVMTPIAVELARRPKLTRRRVTVTVADGSICVAFD
jgi:ABC-type cobalamin transport system permease subunit